MILSKLAPTLVSGTVWLMLLAGCGGGGASDASSSGAPQGSTPTPSIPPTTQTPLPDGPTVSPTPIVSPARQDALRFLEQATFGPTASELEKVLSKGIEGYLDEQLQQPKTGYVGLTRTAIVQPDDCKMDPNDPDSAASLCARKHYTLFEVQRQFFANAMNGQDQLRQRVAFALSQLFVVSGTEIRQPAGMASYQNMLLDGAFGNFRTLLEDVTLHPVMGVYLDMVNNGKGSATSKPNENYAREFMQLFTIGTVQLNQDGTLQVDAHGEPLPTYTQEHVEAYARALTGWTFEPWGNAAPRWGSSMKLVGRMVPIETQHDASAKQLLGVVTSARASASMDLDSALDSVFAHPNVAPFVTTRLIQHLVTSNPTPTYVARMSAVFNDNGSGIRGDLRAIVRAILLDPEARGAVKTDSDYGRLKDPATFMVGFLRALGGTSDGVYLREQAAFMGQNIFTAPSVFNYYSPYQRVGSGELLGPEFGILTDATTLTRTDFVYQLVYGGGVAADATVPGSIGTSINFTSVDSHLALLTQKLSSQSQSVLDQSLNAVATGGEEERARAAAYLLGVSAQFQVQR